MIHTKQITLWVQEEEDGGYSGLIPELPGVHTQGETILETQAMLADALCGVLTTYKEEGIPVPWVTAQARTSFSGNTVDFPLGTDSPDEP